MKDEIKEILDFDFASQGERIEINEYERDILKDYITNLQEENERLKEENKHIFSKVNDDELLISNAMNYVEAQNYKSRIDKAVEYIKEHSDKLKTIRVPKLDFNYMYLLNILTGGEDE